ncbi:MAG TPA: sulfatase-like hydrolase/transferase, partial [Oceanipulchritudo sp.]|nr:sulfatase-like hydrolase/transferase [Oceanipulchritudo sp.]
DRDQPFFSVFNIVETHESRVWRHADLPLLVSPEDIEVPPYYPDNEVVRRDMAVHYSNIARMDAIAGNILDQLEEDGLAESTIIFFFSDHGDGLPRMKRWTYDSGIHVPFGVRFPDGNRAGETTDRLVSFVDFAPTVLSLAGIPVPDFMMGKPFLGEQESEPRDYVYASHDRMDPSLHCIRTVRENRYKYIRNHMPQRPYVQFLPYRDQMPLMQEILEMRDKGTGNEIQRLWLADRKPPEELYDLNEDPHEINNLAKDPRMREVKDRLSAALDRWMERTGDPLTMPEPELIKKLWPPDGVQPETEPVRFREENGFLILESATNGASIAYQSNGSIGGSHWDLYTGPIPVRNVDTIKALAVRIGYRESAPRQYALKEK